MIERIQDLLVKAMDFVPVDILMYVLVGLLAFIFLVGMIFGGGENARVKRKLKKAIRKIGTREDADQFLAIIPGYVASLFRGSVRMGEPVSSFIFLEPCIFPKHNCLRSAMSRVMMVTSVVFAILLLALGSAAGVSAELWVPVLVILIAGAVLTALSAIIAACAHSDATRTFRKTLSMLDRLLQPDRIVDERYIAEHTVPVVPDDQREYNDETDPKATFEPVEDVKEYQVAPGDIDIFEGDKREPDVFDQLADEQAEHAEPDIFELIANGEMSEEDEELLALISSDKADPAEEANEEVPVEASVEAAENAAPEISSIDEAIAQLLSADSVEEMETVDAHFDSETMTNDMSADSEYETSVNIEEMYQSYGETDYDPDAHKEETLTFEPEPLDPETEALFNRIQEISENGAPISDMKDIAAQLKIEREKPQNATENRQKMIDGAFATLLRGVPKAKR